MPRGVPPILHLIRKLMYQLHHLWIATAVAAILTLIEILGRKSESRTSIAANRHILESLEPSQSVFAFAIFGTLVSLFVMRRRLKQGVIRRLGVRWQRVISGLIIPLLVPAFLLRDIDRLAQAPREHSLTRHDIRKISASWLAFIPSVALLVLFRFESPLNYALLGITYVTEGTQAIDDPRRYVLKWVQPELITGSLDKYSKYIWIGSIGYCVALLLCSISMWIALNRACRMTKRVLK